MPLKVQPQEEPPRERRADVTFLFPGLLLSVSYSLWLQVARISSFALTGGKRLFIFEDDSPLADGGYSVFRR